MMKERIGMFELTLPSPLYRLESLSLLWGVDLWVKRDDLIPQFFGGNKTRKNRAIFKSRIEKSGIPDVVITNGGVNSNHARVVALMAKQLGCSCDLVLHGQKPLMEIPTNLSIAKIAGAQYHIVQPSDIREKIAKLCAEYRSLGMECFVIPGGAHTLEAAMAYEKAVQELPFEPDYIVHASGTGGTQAGLLRGIFKNNLKTQLMGVSVARNSKKGVAAIAPLLEGYSIAEKSIRFFDEFTFGGYGHTTRELSSFIQTVIAAEGMPLDGTYTGKAMYGLHQLVKKKVIKKGSQVIFWHTGGI